MAIDLLFDAKQHLSKTNNANIVDLNSEIKATNLLADIISETTDVIVQAKNFSVTAAMLERTNKLYACAKRYGVDNVFVSLYNQNHELDHFCGIRFPSCESFSAVGNPRSRYSAAFIASMEDENTGWWDTVKDFIEKIWLWIKNNFSKLWHKILEFFNLRAKDLDSLIKDIHDNYDQQQEIDIAKCYYLQIPILNKKGHDEILTAADNLQSRIPHLMGTLKNIVNEDFSFWSKENIADREDDLRCSMRDFNDLTQDLISTYPCIQNAREKKSAGNGNTKLVLSKLLNSIRPIYRQLGKIFKQCDDIKEQNSQLAEDIKKAINDSTELKTKNAPAINHFFLRFVTIPKQLCASCPVICKDLIKYINGIYKDLKWLRHSLKAKE